MENLALKFYDEGYNCAQSVLKSYIKEFNLDEDEILKMTMGLGFGMFMGETCGAITGVLMALGLQYGNHMPNDRNTMRQLYKQIKTFETKFKEKNHSLNCKELKHTYKVDCRVLIKDATELLKNQLNLEEVSK